MSDRTGYEIALDAIKRVGEAQVAERDARIAKLEKALRLAGSAMDVADRLIERGYGIDKPEDWDLTYRGFAEASREALS